MIRYFDASALVKRYVREAGSAQVGRWLADGQASTARYSRIEIASALCRRHREGSLSTDNLARTLSQLDSDLHRLLVVELTPAVTEAAEELLRNHALRAGDALQLASAARLRQRLGEDLGFICFDERLREAASHENFVTD